MERAYDSKTHFSSVKHAWEIVQKFKNLPKDDPLLMLDENMMICNPVYCAALDYVIEHRDEDPEIYLYFRAISETFAALCPTYHRQEDGLFKKCEPKLSFCKDQSMTLGEVISDPQKSKELAAHVRKQLAIDILD